MSKMTNEGALRRLPNEEMRHEEVRRQHQEEMMALNEAELRFLEERGYRADESVTSLDQRLAEARRLYESDMIEQRRIHEDDMRRRDEARGIFEGQAGVGDGQAVLGQVVVGDDLPHPAPKGVGGVERVGGNNPGGVERV